MKINMVKKIDVSNDNNRANNKNRHMQVPTGHVKQTKNTLMRVEYFAIGSGGDERKRASHVANELEKQHADEIKECLIARVRATNDVKKMEASKALSIMEEANTN